MYNMGCFFLVQQKGYVTTLQETNNNKYEQLTVARTNIVNNISRINITKLDQPLESNSVGALQKHNNRTKTK